jgi:hypothetical protein
MKNNSNKNDERGCNTEFSNQRHRSENAEKSFLAKYKK